MIRFPSEWRRQSTGDVRLFGAEIRITRILISTPISLLGAGLSDLLLQLLAGVADALVLVRVGLAKGAHIGGDLAYLLPVDAGDGDVCLLRVDGDFDAARQGELDRMRVARREYDHALTLHLNAVTDSDDIQLLRPARRHPVYGVEDESAGEPVKRSLLVILTLRNQVAVLLDEGDATRKHRCDLALGTFDQDGIAVDGVLDTGAHWGLPLFASLYK